MMECYPGIEQTELFIVLRRVMEAGAPQRLRNEFSYPSGLRRWFDLVVDPVPDGVCILSLDVTGRRTAEIELQHAQRIEATGKLAGGVAHDFTSAREERSRAPDLVLTDIVLPGARALLERIDDLLTGGSGTSPADRWWGKG